MQDEIALKEGKQEIMANSVCIIGAGFSGLVSIKCCLDAGLSPVCYEKDSNVGGLWNKNNPQTVPYCTITNTSKEMSCLSDFPMPDDYPNFIPPDELMDYFYSYADKFDLLKHVQLDTEVTKIGCNETEAIYESNGTYWIATTLAHGKTEKVKSFDFLIVSAGFNRTPFMPENVKEQIKHFSGRVIHSSEYKSWQNFENENVVVSGFGNSSGDISAELSRHAKSVCLATKHGSYIFNRLMFSGYPFDANVLRRSTGWLPVSLKNFALKKLCNSVIDHFNFGLAPLSASDETALVIPVINDEIPTRIATGHIVVKPEIQSVNGHQVAFRDGTTAEEVDSIICCTGYKRHFSFLENANVFSFGNDGKSFPLYKNIFPVDHRGKVAFIGTTAVQGSVFPVYEMQARCAVQVFLDNVILPSKDEMRCGIEKEAEEARSIYGKEMREQMRVSYNGYQDELASIIGVKPNILKLFFTDPILAYHLLFGPSCPYQYRLGGCNSWSGARNAILTVNQRIWKPFQQRKTSRNTSTFSPIYYLIFLAAACLVYQILIL